MNYFEYIVSNIDLLFITELILAEAVLLFTHRRRKLSFVKIPLSIAICLLVSFLYPAIPDSIILTILRYVVLFILTVIGVYISFDCRFSEAMFFCVGAYAMQHLSYTIYLNLFMFLVVKLQVIQGKLYVRLLEFGVCVLTYAVCWILFGRKMNEIGYRKKSLIFLIPSVILVFTSISVCIYEMKEHLFDFVINLYPLVSCIIVLFLLFGVQSLNELQIEKDKIKLIAEKNSEHYELYKENVDALNLKFHDLKYFLAANSSNAGHKEDYFESLKRSVSIYDSIAKTGNEALDAILTEKKLICENRKITFTYMVNGSMLDFLSSIDIYVLIGNALDNAIESVEKVDEELRVINLTVIKKDELLNIHADNYFDGKISFKDGLPLTTKDDRNSHGFGMKSMRMIVEKYGGSMNISAEDNIFNLNIIFTLK